MFDTRNRMAKTNDPRFGWWKLKRN